ncbi:PEP/pyruvate-binding domain-containing protein [Amycolatopsis sp. NPDC006131]|uniref:PEP/pyruvate-binding domain-containing protein n=1 Tax=Amycolatopsis sp. NPDC006131 TaxID=3156731 RepID=UPI0033B0C1BA
MNYIHAFTDPGTPERAVIGGKGLGLVRLAAAGVRVPPGFVVTTASYRDFVAENGLSEEIDGLVRDVDHEDAEALTAATRQIQERIASGALPGGLDERIAKAYSALGTGEEVYVAVRSSGTAEDMGDASFAGLYDSYLDIRGAEDVVDAVRRCWASLWTPRCAAYRKRLGFDHRDAEVAVVVQQMVAADTAGVLFTANPLTERTDEYVVNASWGLGESIASGIVTPDELILDAATLAVKRSTVGSKQWRIDRAAAGSGTSKTATTAQDAARRCLDDATAAELGAQGRRILELCEGIPQDIEWAVSDGELFILQSRDITGAGFLWEEDIESWQSAPDDEETVWSHTWAEAFWTGAVTPLFYSVRGRELRNSDERLFTLWGFDDLAKMRRFKYRRNTVYFSSDADRIYYRNLLPARLRKHSLDNLPPDWRDEAGAARFDPAKAARMYARVRALTTDHGPLRTIKSVYRFIDDRAAEANSPSAAELRLLSDHELRKEIASKIKLFEDYLTVLRPAFHVYATTAFAILRELLAAWYDGDNPYVFQDLISGLPKRTAMLQEQVDLWELAAELRRSSTVVALLEKSTNGAEFFAAVREEPAGADFCSRYDEFMAAHGHRGHQDRDLWYPRRSEDPDIDFQSLRSLVAADSPSPVDNEHRLVAKREEVTAEVIERIRAKPFGSIRAELFKAVLDYIHRFLVLRDDERPFADAITMGKKRAFVELGRRLYERKLIDDPDDFYHLAEYELYDLLDGRVSRRLVRAKVRNRRAVFDKFIARSEIPADYLRGNTPMEVDDGTDTGLEGTFAGVGMSRGSVTGTARIVGDLRDIGRVRRSEILVCNSTDPGWTPVFGLISGLILEAGGMLSHGACLSREYGLPAVNLPGAMQKIPDGATISVNGDTGRVSVVTEDD